MGLAKAGTRHGAIKAFASNQSQMMSNAGNPTATGANNVPVSVNTPRKLPQPQPPPTAQQPSDASSQHLSRAHSGTSSGLQAAALTCPQPQKLAAKSLPVLPTVTDNNALQPNEGQRVLLQELTSMLADSTFNVEVVECNSQVHADHHIRALPLHPTPNMKSSFAIAR